MRTNVKKSVTFPRSAAVGAAAVPTLLFRCRNVVEPARPRPAICFGLQPEGLIVSFKNWSGDSNASTRGLAKDADSPHRTVEHVEGW
jgi:hypothetical protein